MRDLLFFSDLTAVQVNAESLEGDQACVPQTVVLFVLAKLWKITSLAV